MDERMIQSTLGRPWELVISASSWRQLFDHLFPGDGDEHGAVILGGFANGHRGSRVLVREILLAQDGIDYVPGTFGYRALTPTFIAKAIRRAKTGGWIYLAVHCHGGTDSVQFSSTDMNSHERGYPALLQLSTRPVGALVFAQNAVDGDVWTVDGDRVGLKSVRIVGDNIKIVGGKIQLLNLRNEFDRQARLLGQEGQKRLEEAKVAIVGLGGAGSMAAEMLTRLGVGNLVLIDPDRLDRTNLSRIVGSSEGDLGSNERRSWFKLWPRNKLERCSKLKVDIASELASRSKLITQIEAIPLDVSSSQAVNAISDCDWIFLAADSQTARHIVNAVAHAYLIPVIQVGVKIPVEVESGHVGSIFATARHITPEKGCLWCNGLIDATNLQLEATGESGIRAREYVGTDAPAPSVISLNGIAVSLGVTQLLLSTVGLLEPEATRPSAGYQRFLPRTHKYYNDEPRKDSECLHCGNTDISLFARGDFAEISVQLNERVAGTREKWLKRKS